MRGQVILLVVVLASAATKPVCCQPSREAKAGVLTASDWLLADGVAKNQLLGELQDVDLENAPIQNKDHLNLHLQRPSCHLVQIIHLLKHVGCQTKAIASFACSGSCSSYVQMSGSNFWQHERSCSCCQQTGLQEATFTLDCPSLSPPYKKIKTYSPVDCMCRACADLGKENLQPQELVEALAIGSTTEDDKL